MKTFKFIFEKVVTLENLAEAIKKSSSGKRHRPEVQKVLANPDQHIKIIQELLINNKFVPCKPIERTIKDGSSRKTRTITKIKYFPDQIIHWALMIQLKPIFMMGAYKYSCGSIPGRGIHYGKKALSKWLKDEKNSKYVAKLDIKKFYPSIDHDKMKATLRTRIKDPKILNVLDSIINSYDNGLPIGFLTSQWFANFFLQKLDHFIKQGLKIKYYIRYMDDMVLLGSNKRKLHKHIKSISELLNSEKLIMKNNWQVFRIACRDIDFMGFRFYRDKIIIRKNLMLRISRRANRIKKIKRITFHDAASMVSYMGWIKHSDSHKFYLNRIKKFVCIGRLKKIISRVKSKGFIL